MEGCARQNTWACALFGRGWEPIVCVQVLGDAVSPLGSLGEPGFTDGTVADVVSQRASHPGLGT